MATQSLYRRYRPRRFSEVKGQDHIVKALRDSVAAGREGQAYLFSGPRGTGKTTTARILAKVLNCENVIDGEPCCECESCVSVERGTSYDVHELDAASNNGVDAIRDLVEKASLGTPGRHKVYILDEVHMLSKGAEAALLKTLEEPPPHVVFVLATTDPQKMSDTIRSRTQHLQFHLLPSDTLAEHLHWVADDAGLDLSQAALDAALTRGGGSARDTLSALELLASTGGDVSDEVDLDEFLVGLIENDSGRVLTAMGHAVGLGRDPRTITEDIVRHLRDAFLSLMAPELVVLPSERVDVIAAQAQQLGAAALVRAIERLGSILVDMRHAPDPRILVEVALVQLTHAEAGSDTDALAARVDRLETTVRQLREANAGAVAAAAVPKDPATGRAVLGGAAKRPARAASSPGADSPAASSSPAGSPPASSPTAESAAASPSATGSSTAGSPASGSPAASPSTAGSSAAGSSTAGPATAESASTAASGATPPGGSAGAAGESAGSGAAEAAGGASVSSGPQTAASDSPGSGAAAPPGDKPAEVQPSAATTNEAPNSGSGAEAPAGQPPAAQPAATAPPQSAPTADTSRPTMPVPDAWEQTVKSQVKPLARALYSGGTFVGNRGDVWQFSVPNETHGSKCEQHRADVEAALAQAVGAPVTIEFVVGGAAGGPAPATSQPPKASEPEPKAATSESSPAAVPRPSAAALAAEPEPEVELQAHVPEADEDVDLHELTDAPPESVKTPIDHLAEAFPGSELMTDD